MNKMNKKGFTLIEMLVVIAIIAVLVSIIIPTVSSATDKAKAATDAANLRSMLAEATTDYLAGVTETAGYVSYTAGSNGTAGTFSVNSNAPECKTNKEWKPTIAFVNGQIVAKYGNATLSDFQTVAENGGTVTASGSTNTPT